MKKLNNKGFTLIEVIAVLVILSTIMTIAIPSLTSALSLKKEKENSNTEQKVYLMAELYLTNNNFDFNTSECYIDIDTLFNEGYINESDLSSDEHKYIVYKKIEGYSESTTKTSNICINET